MAHTPGPWVVGGPYPAVSVCFVADSDPTDGERWETIAELWYWQQGEAPDEVKANARLMAAAPEMLEALKMARGWIEEALIEDHLPVGEHSPTLKAIDAVIAKAEGQP